jgi:insulysin
MAGRAKLFLSVLLAAATAIDSIRVFNGITKPRWDRKRYRGLVLDNGMKVILVSDPNAHKSAAALQVDVGYMSQPRNIGGLAHFCEHMLFMGTRKYPNENYYDRYLSTHGGTSNAFTTTDNTIYTFDVASQDLPKALDIFAQFFIAPLFLADSVGRETQAVHSEYISSLSNDDYRYNQVMTQVGNVSHDYSKFDVGSRQTLYDVPKTRGQNPRTEVLKFWRQHYSANLMSLAVIGKKSLKELRRLVVARFSSIKNKQFPIRVWPNPYTPRTLGKMIKIAAVDEKQKLNFFFPVKNFDSYQKHRPDKLLKYLFELGGPGTLTAYLADRGWHDEASFEVDSPARGFANIVLSFDLTTAGQNKVRQLGVALFQYVNAIRQSKRLRFFYREAAKRGRFEFQTQERQPTIDLVQALAAALAKVPFRKVLEADYTLEKFNQPAFYEFLDSISPENMFIVRFSDLFPENTLPIKDSWYNVSYSVAPVPRHLSTAFARVGNAKGNFKLPLIKEFIPSLKLKPRDKSNGRTPDIIMNNELVQAWYHQDKQFGNPKGYLWIKMTTEFENDDPFYDAMLHLLAQMLKAQTDAELDALDHAELDYDVVPGHASITVSLSGYTAKQAVIVQKLFQFLAKDEVTKKDFNEEKDKYLNELSGSASYPSFDHAETYVENMLTANSWTFEELTDVLEEVTVKDLDEFMDLFMEKLHVQMLASGNYRRLGAKAIAANVNRILSKNVDPEPVDIDQPPLHQAILMKPGETAIISKKQYEEQNSGVINYYICGLATERTKLVVGLLHQILQTPVFNQLRTKEQLGYTVEAKAAEVDGLEALTFLVVSLKSPQYLNQRIEAFLRKAKTILGSMTEKQFRTEKYGFSTKRFEPPRSLKQKAEKQWEAIMAGDYEFDQEKREKALLKKITLAELRKMFTKCLDPSNRKRRIAGSWVTGATAKSEGYKPKAVCGRKIRCVSNIEGFQRKHMLVHEQDRQDSTSSTARRKSN